MNAKIIDNTNLLPTKIELAIGDWIKIDLNDGQGDEYGQICKLHTVDKFGIFNAAGEQLMFGSDLGCDFSSLVQVYEYLSKHYKWIPLKTTITFERI